MRFINRQRAWYFVAAVGGGLFFAVGCNKEQGEKLMNVSGKINTVDGRPVTTGNVTFYPDTSKANSTGHQPMGVLDPEGNYELFVPGGKKGAPAGWYKIVVYAIDDPQPGKPNKYLVNKDYADVTTTPLKIEVIESPEPGRYDLQLRR
jgi:hypothetical protein